MRDYSKSKIYHIVCNITGQTYYGSTVQRISQRMNGHRKKDHKCVSKPIIERGDYHYGLVEDYKCENSEQLRMRERYYVDNNDCVNKNSPIRTKEEKISYFKAYHEANKDKIRERKKREYETNKDKISEHNNEKVICECGCEISRTNLYVHRKRKFHQEFIQSLGSGGNTI